MTSAPALGHKNNADFAVVLALSRQGFAGSPRSILHKGNSNSERSFAFWVHPTDTRLQYRVSTATNSDVGGDSRTKVALNTWTHVACVKAGRQLQLYLNGRLDAATTLAADVVSNTGPIHIGKDPWYPGFEGRLDDLRLYNFALSSQGIEALATRSAGDVDPPVGTGERDYRLAAYQSLLARIGTSYEEIRLIRGGTDDERQALPTGSDREELGQLLVRPGADRVARSRVRPAQRRPARAAVDVAPARLAARSVATMERR